MMGAAALRCGSGGATSAGSVTGAGSLRGRSMRATGAVRSLLAAAEGRGADGLADSPVAPPIV